MNEIEKPGQNVRRLLCFPGAQEILFSQLCSRFDCHPGEVEEMMATCTSGQSVMFVLS